MRNRSWVSCRGWPNCFACAIDRGLVVADGRACFACVIDRGLVAADGRTALRERAIVG